MRIVTIILTLFFTGELLAQTCDTVRTQEYFSNTATGWSGVHDLTELSDGSFVATGYKSRVEGGTSIHTFKLDSNLNHLWEHNYHHDYDYLVRDAKIVTHNGDIYVSALLYQFGRIGEIVTLKYSKSGVLDWTRKTPVERIDLISFSGNFEYDNVIYIGYARYTSDISSFLMQIDTSGSVVNSTLQLPDSNIVVQNIFPGDSLFHFTGYLPLGLERRTVYGRLFPNGVVDTTFLLDIHGSSLTPADIVITPNGRKYIGSNSKQRDSVGFFVLDYRDSIINRTMYAYPGGNGMYLGNLFSNATGVDWWGHVETGGISYIVLGKLDSNGNITQTDTLTNTAGLEATPYGKPIGQGFVVIAEGPAANELRLIKIDSNNHVLWEWATDSTPVWRLNALVGPKESHLIGRAGIAPEILRVDHNGVLTDSYSIVTSGTTNEYLVDIKTFKDSLIYAFVIDNGIPGIYKLDRDLDTIWKTQYFLDSNIDQGYYPDYKMVVDVLGNVYITHYIQSTLQPLTNNIRVVSVSAGGNFRWAKELIIHPVARESTVEFVWHPNGYVLLSGYSLHIGLEQTHRVYRIDPSGRLDTLFERTANKMAALGGTRQPYHAIPRQDGSTFITSLDTTGGKTGIFGWLVDTSSILSGPSLLDTFSNGDDLLDVSLVYESPYILRLEERITDPKYRLTKYDTDGLIRWSHLVDTPVWGQYGQKILPTTNGKLLVTNLLYLDPQNSNLLYKEGYAALWDTSGYLVWEQLLEPGFNAMAVDKGPDFLFAGNKLTSTQTHLVRYGHMAVLDSLGSTYCLDSFNLKDYPIQEFEGGGPFGDGVVLGYQMATDYNAKWEIRYYEKNTYSGIESEDLLHQDEGIVVRIYPNPATNHITLEWNENPTNGKLILYDLHGRVLLQQSVQESTTVISIGHLSPALYLAVLHNMEGNVVWRGKVMVN